MFADHRAQSLSGVGQAGQPGSAAPTRAPKPVSPHGTAPRRVDIFSANRCAKLAKLDDAILANTVVPAGALRSEAARGGGPGGSCTVPPATVVGPCEDVFHGLPAAGEWQQCRGSLGIAYRPAKRGIRRRGAVDGNETARGVGKR